MAVNDGHDGSSDDPHLFVSVNCIYGEEQAKEEIDDPPMMMIIMKKTTMMATATRRIWEGI